MGNLNYWTNKVAVNGSLSRSALLVLIVLKHLTRWNKTQSELGDLLQLDRKTINAAVRQLVEAGLVTKTTPLKGDARIPQLAIRKERND